MNKLALIIGLAFIGFFVVLAGFIGSRLNEQTVTMLAGLSCGVGVATPIGAMLGWYFHGRRSNDRVTATPQPMMIVTQPQQPTAPQINPGYAPQSINNSWGGAYPNAAPRQFTIVGEEPTNHEPDSIW
jgi:hypothetical protein